MGENIKKRFVFYFYLFNGWELNEAIQIHLKCIEYYASIFDEILFYISCDKNTSDEDKLNLKKYLISLPINNITIKITENNGFGECICFRDEIVNKLQDLDGLTFFGHTKGVVSNYKIGVDIESCNNWLLLLYYLNLCDIDTVVKSLYTIGSARFFYSLIIKNNFKLLNMNFNIAGTFYWMNCGRIYSDIGNDKYLTKIDDRWYAERFPTKYYEFDTNNVNGFGSSLYGLTDFYFTSCNPYTDLNDDALKKYIMNDDIYNGFINFKNKILKNNCEQFLT